MPPERREPSRPQATRSTCQWWQRGSMHAIDQRPRDGWLVGATEVTSDGARASAGQRSHGQSALAVFWPSAKLAYAYLATAFVPPCIPTRAVKPPAGPDWVHEIKHDGYRLQVRREGDTVRLFTRNGYDWSARYPAISVTDPVARQVVCTRRRGGRVRSRRRGRVRRAPPARHRHRGDDVRVRPPGTGRAGSTRSSAHRKGLQEGSRALLRARSESIVPNRRRRTFDPGSGN
jgi:hypothetical protein